MSLLAEFSVLARPAYKLVVIRDYDADADVDNGQALTQAISQVATSNEYQLFLGSLEDSGKVRVRLCVWDSAAPAENSEDWDGERHLELVCNTGNVIVEQLTLGPAARWQLPSGPGRYTVRVSFRNRELRAERVASIQQRTPNQNHVPRLLASVAALDGMEEYLISMWRVDQPGEGQSGDRSGPEPALGSGGRPRELAD